MNIESQVLQSVTTVIISDSEDKTVRSWNSQSGESIGAPLVGHVGDFKSVEISYDGTMIVSGSSDKKVRR